MTVVALRQRYDGHAKRAGLRGCAQLHGAHRRGGRRGHRSIKSRRCDVGGRDAQRADGKHRHRRNAWSSALDPRIPPDDKERGVTSHSKAIIEACRPFAWRDQFPPPSALSAEEAREIEEKWGIALSLKSSS